ncbi:MAG: TRAP transporter small permease [Gemmatimonadaceae bacterium]|nr:TRAP transporter small permease [Acetobacteraceae bacterium]
MLRRFNYWYSRVLIGLMVVTVGALVLPVTLQIFSRFTSLIPHYIWTEEMARLMLVWSVMLGAMIGVREGAHFTVDVFPLLSARVTAGLELVVGVFILLFAAVFVWWGWEFTEFAWYRVSELAELPLWAIHVAWPLAGVTWLLFMAERMANDVQTLRDGIPRNVNSVGGTGA